MKSNSLKTDRLQRRLTALLMAACALVPTAAAAFSAMVSPPRFELQGAPGSVIRESVEIQNASDLPATFKLRTADWDLTDTGGVTIHPPELQPGSCRPWARIERRSLRLRPQATKRFRFELHVPAGATPGECRLALLLEPDEADSVMARARNIRFPVTGRIAIIIYIAVGDAAPLLELKALELREVNARLTPVAVLHNTGNAHGRPEGFLEGRDASGRRLDFSVSPSPIMPGQTRTIPVWEAVAEGEERHVLQPPLKVKGAIEWRGGRHAVDSVLE